MPETASFKCAESGGPKQAVDLGVRSQWEQKYYQPIQITGRKMLEGVKSTVTTDYFIFLPDKTKKNSTVKSSPFAVDGIL